MTNEAEELLKDIVANATHIGGDDYRVTGKYLERAEKYLDLISERKPVKVFCSRYLSPAEKKDLPDFMELKERKNLVKYVFKPLTKAQIAAITDQIPGTAVLFMIIGHQNISEEQEKIYLDFIKAPGNVATEQITGRKWNEQGGGFMQ